MSKKNYTSLKKVLFSCSAFALTCGSLTTPTLGAGIQAIYTNNTPITFESAQPYINNQNYTMIPFRKLSEAVAIKIDWQSPYVIAEGIHQQTGEALTVRIKASEYVMMVNNAIVPIATPTVLSSDGYTYIPLRLFVEIFGYAIDWQNGVININPLPSNGSDTNTPSGGDSPNVPSVPSTPSAPETSVPDTSAPDTSAPDTSAPTDFASQVLVLVNTERSKAGLSALTLDNNVSAVAQEKSKDMRINNYFSHNSPVYGTPFDMLNQFGIQYSSAGENIAMGYASPEAVVNGWMNSSGHRANILNTRFTHMGIGYDSNGHYWTQMFVSY